MTKSLDVWTYWQGDRLPLIETCLRSIGYVCKGEVDFHLLTPENLHEYLDPGVLHPSYTQMTQPNMAANCIRAALLATYGGWWWDADTVGLRSPLHLTQRYPKASSLYMTWNQEPRRILNGYIYMRPGCSEAQEWLSRVNYRLEHEFKLANVWAHLGEKLLTPTIDSGKYPDATPIPLATYLPIDIDVSPAHPLPGSPSSVETFFSPGDFRDYVQDHTVAYGLNYSYFVYWHPKEMKVGPAEWAESSLLLHQLMDHAHTR